MNMDQPDETTCRLVDDRDNRCCVRCGVSLYAVTGSRHHRKLRSQCSRQEKHTASNLILLCGSGTTGCHGWVHAHPELAYESGLMVHAWDDPALVPVETKRYGTVLLDNQGGMKENT